MPPCPITPVPSAACRRARPGRWRRAALLLGLCGAWAAAVQAQSFCASDGQPRPTAVLERFIGADCEGCWSDAASPVPARGAVALDWIVPSARGDEAPLSAAARRDALDRLAALGRPAPALADLLARPVQAAPRGAALRLRVSHGLPFNDYLAASVELKPAQAPQRHGPLTAWLVLVENVPAGSEGTPVARSVVRNALQQTWSSQPSPPRGGAARLVEQRSFYLPEGTRPERLRAIGWVEDARGRVLAAAQSRCAQPAR